MRALLHWRRFREGPLAFGGSFADRSLLRGDFHQRTIEPLMKNPAPALRVLHSADLSVVNRLEQIHRAISQPVICIWGEQDQYFPVARAKTMVENWPSASLTVLSPAGLLVHEEQPAQSLDEMRRFLLQIWPKPSASSTPKDSLQKVSGL